LGDLRKHCKKNVQNEVGAPFPSEVAGKFIFSTTPKIIMGLSTLLLNSYNGDNFLWVTRAELEADFSSPRFRIRETLPSGFYGPLLRRSS
jgi:hypothetical protein